MPDDSAQLERQNAALTRQLLEWIASAPRTYQEAIDTWRSSCPRHSIWEDALEAGLIESGAALGLTAEGRRLLARRA
jgi:hypothetical protein